jgi:hypothetical protein
MAVERRYTLRQAVHFTVGVVLVAALCAEIMTVLTADIGGIERWAHLLFAAIAAAGAILVFCNVNYSSYTVLPPALAIFFYEVYRTVSEAISAYTVVSGLCFFVAALFCFMLIRAHKT